MFRNILSIETQKIFNQSMLRIQLAVLAAVVIGMQLVMFSMNWIVPAEAGSQSAEVASQAREFFIWPGALINALNMAGANGLGGVLVIVLMGAAVTQEYQWRTLHLWLSRGVPRPAYGLARFLSIVLPALVFALAALLVGGLGSLLIQLGLGSGLPVDQVRLGALLPAVLRTAYTLLPYAGLAFLLGVLTRSVAATVAIGMAFVLLFENLLGQILTLMGGLPAQAVNFLPARMANVLVEGNAAIAAGYSGAPAGDLGLAPATAALGLALYTLLFLGLGIWKLYRQDLTA